MPKPRIYEFRQPEAFIDRRTVITGPGQRRMRCGRCGQSGFAVHIRPEQDGAGRVEDLVCASCSAVYKLNMHGQVAGEPR